MIKNDTCRNALIEENTGLVHACTHRFCGRGIDYEDLFSAGCVGLVKAADRFDSERGVRFSTYAVPVILGEIRKLFRDGGTVKVSRSLKELSLKISKKREEYFASNGKEATVSFLADSLGLSAEQVAQAIGAGIPVVSLTEESDEKSCQTDIPVKAIDDELTDRICLQQAIDKLEPSDRQLIELRYFRCMTQTETAEKIGMTQVQVSRREKKILGTLRMILE